MIWRYCICFLLCCFMGFCLPHEASSDEMNELLNSNLLNLERMEAGVPAGWHVSGDSYEWSAENAPGPLGIGSARIQFGDSGRVSLTSPARFMRHGVSHALSLWLRSKPAGAVVRIALRDNDSDDSAGFDKRFVATQDWQQVTFQDVLPKAVRDRYYVALAASGKNCILWLDGLWFGEYKEQLGQGWEPSNHQSGVTLEPETAWGLVVGKNPLKIVARVVGVTQKNCQLHLRIIHSGGMTQELPSVPLDDSGIWRKTIHINGEIAQLYGMLRLEATVVDADGKPLSPMSETLLAHAPEPIPGPIPESSFGIHVSLREPDLEAVAKLGYKWCRIHDASGITKCGYAEPEPDKWVWFDEQVDLVRKHGLCILGMLDGSPPWESGSPHSGYFSIYGAPRNIGNWRNYVNRVLSHYAGRIDHWEVWNELWDMRPEGFFQNGTPKLYVELLKAAYEEAKITNPDCTIIGVDTYPAFWDHAVLSLGALPHYDVLSWHRYDPGLHGYFSDAIARVSDRLREEQAKYGTPKPLICSEGGPDVSLYHGSFFSFADPVLSGNWSRGADQLARMYLSCITSGNQKFFLYSVHNDNRHGRPIHMCVEPGFLLRPMHLTVAALAHFVEGARYEKCLKPSHDISAHVFRQLNNRPYADGPSVVVVLISNGEESEDLPVSLPSNILCFDRWGNPADVPTHATRSPVYLVAMGEAEMELLKAFRGESLPEISQRGIQGLIDNTVASLTGNDPPLWMLFSSQGSIAIKSDLEGSIVRNRASLKAEGGFQLPAGTEVVDRYISGNGGLYVGWVKLVSNGAKWIITFSAVQDGPDASWRYTTLTILQGEQQDYPQEASHILKQWEQAMVEGDLLKLHYQLSREVFCGAISSLDNDIQVFTNPNYYLMMLHNSMGWTAPTESVMLPKIMSVCGDMATVAGEWKFVSPFFELYFGAKPFVYTATMLRSQGQWRIASLYACPQRVIQNE